MLQLKVTHQKITVYFSSYNNCNHILVFMVAKGPGEPIIAIHVIIKVTQFTFKQYIYVQYNIICMISLHLCQKFQRYLKLRIKQFGGSGVYNNHSFYWSKTLKLLIKLKTNLSDFNIHIKTWRIVFKF